jgi:YD repeat-containing protein
MRPDPSSYDPTPIRDGAARAPDGSPTAIIGPYGQQTTLALDQSGYLASVTDPAGSQEQFSYDGAGLMLTHTDPNGHGSSYRYDGEGRLIKDTDAVGASLCTALPLWEPT